LIDYKWNINTTKLRAMPDNAWQLQLLDAGSDRLSGETGREVVARLRRETLLQRYYFSIVHPDLCQNNKTRAEIKAILKEFGLGEFAGLASPKGLIATGCVKLYAVLMVAASSLPAAAIAVTTLAICVIGLNRICKSSKAGRKPTRKPARKPTRKPKPVR
jgi:hypothetical protein